MTLIPGPIRRIRLLLLLALAALTIVPAAQGEVNQALQAKLLADPAYKAYEDKKSAILRSGLKGEARSRALKALQDANRAVIEKAWGAAGVGHLLANTVRVLPEGAFAVPFTMDGDTRVYLPPFKAFVANHGDVMPNGWVVAESDTFDDNGMTSNTYRSYAGVDIDVPPNAVAMLASAEVDVGHATVDTNAGLTSASARAGVMLQATGAMPGDGFFDVLLIRQDGSLGTHDHWDSYKKPGLKRVTSLVIPVKAGGNVRVAGGVTARVESSWGSSAFASATGYVRRLLVRFVYAPAPTPTPIPIFAATPAPAVIPEVARKMLAGPADVALFALPAGDGWPMELVVKNLGGKASESTLVRARVVLKNVGADDVAKSCAPRFVDFDEAVPALEPGGSAAIPLLTKALPAAVAAWNALNKPALARERPVSAPATAATRSPIAHIVDCRYTLTAGLGANQNHGDPHPENNTLTREIREAVSAK
ncbi:MAG: hypothetical protein IPL89_15255 [Acidobacteria bacterium]|nr:hypothetical protein [Acidobacteriota bacterium]